MPEFAEVNYQVKWLRERVTGWTLASHGVEGRVHFPGLKDDPRAATILGGFFRGARLEAVTQRGKFVVFRLSTGTMVSHLMFKGRWSLAGEDFLSPYRHHREAPEAKSNSFWVTGASGRLNFHDPEWKGRVHAFPDLAPGACGELAELGPEVLVTAETDPDFAASGWGAEDFARGLAKTKVAVKAYLLDQKKQAGVGNMYACEGLYRARIAPERPSNTLTGVEAARLWASVREVLGEAIASGLDYARVLAVYKRERDPAGRVVACATVGGRDTYWVPELQA